MALSPLAPVTDYQSMLSRVFWFTSVAALCAVWLLRDCVPLIDSYLQSIDLMLRTPSGDMLPIPGGTLVPALVIGLSARVFRLHGHLAHMLGVRERFDIDVIITTLAEKSGVDVPAISDEQWQERRHPIMQQTFYRFANSRSSEIDPHLIHQALDSWSWFWIGLEAAVVFVLAGLVLISFHAYAAGGMTTACTLTLAGIGLPLVRMQCKRFALAQVRAILADPGRAEIVRQAFQGLPQVQSPLRRSA